MTHKAVELDSVFANMLRTMGNIPADKLGTILSKCYRRTLPAHHILSHEGEKNDFIFFTETGAIRHFTIDNAGNEHTTQFAFENAFSSDYAAFTLKKKSQYSVQTLMKTSVIYISRDALEWLRENVADGEKLIRIVTESFFIYFANRLRDNYVLTPLERYQETEKAYPGIYEIVPQYMIASYIGVSKVHLSRLKSQSLKQKPSKK